MRISATRSGASGLCLSVALVLALGSAPGVEAQERAALALDYDRDTGRPVLLVGDLLERDELREAVRSGLPLRIDVELELWRDRFLDALEGQGVWRASLRYDPVETVYRVEVAGDDGTLAVERFTGLPEATAALQRRFRSGLRPEREGRFYYLAEARIETLSLSDLEELRRWLRGDFGPAVSGEEEVEGAVARGVRRLFVRILGLPAVRLELRTEVFDWPTPTARENGEGDQDQPGSAPPSKGSAPPSKE